MHKAAYMRYPPHLRIFAPGTKSSGMLFGVNCDSMMFRIKLINVAAAAFIPGVLQKISTVRPKRKPQMRSSLRFVWRGSLSKKIIYMHAVA